MERGQLGEGLRALQQRLKLRRLALIITAAAALAFPGAAAALERITSPFLLEYSSPTYVVDQGELVIFENRDPFMRHGLSSDAAAGPGTPLFSAPVVPRGEVRLVRGVPFLSGAGTTFRFRDPAHPGMTAELVLGPAGTPLPPDTVPPSAGLKIRGGLGRLARSGVLRLRIAPAEAMDVTLVAKLGRRRLGRTQRTYLASGSFGLRMRIAAPLRGPSGGKLRVVATLSDVAGNRGSSRAVRRG